MSFRNSGAASAPAMSDPGQEGLELALRLYRLQHWGAAADAFRRLLSYDAYRDRAQLGLGDCLLHLQQPKEALVCFEACGPASHRVPMLLGKAVALQFLRCFDEAEAVYQQILELDPLSQEALGNLIAMSVERFDLTQVRRYALRLIRISPESTIALQALTLVAYERRDYETAASFFSDLMKQAPEGRFAERAESADEIWYRLSWKDVERLSNKFRRVSGPLTNPY